MGSHDASAQMIGYLYQIRYALYLLLNNDDIQSEINIEKFDDVSFGQEGKPKERIQLKHHTKSYGDLSNASTDLWRTLNVWISNINKDLDILRTNKFLIITTAKAPKCSATSYLKLDNMRNTDEAHKILLQTAGKSKNKKHRSYYSSFLGLSNVLQKRLIDSIIIIDSASNIQDTEMLIRKQIRYNCNPEHEDRIFERLEGWWIKVMIDALSSDELIFINQTQVRSYIVSLASQYKEDNLPVDIDLEGIHHISVENLTDNEKIFYEQLELIGFTNERMLVAIKDYYRAYYQRANWVREDLLYINELDEYEKKLINEWDRIFVRIKDDLAFYGTQITEHKKVESGRKLYNEMEEKDYRIRERCNEPFIMRGSYHMLSNELKVGWHIDFYQRLNKLLGGEVGK